VTVRRIRALGRAELTLLVRNRTALFSAVILPFALVGAVAGAKVGHTALVSSALGFVLLAAVYYNLTTAYVARREELVLKRLRIGELTDAEILTGVAAPSIVIALGQCALALAAGAIFLDLPMPSVPLLLLAVVGGSAVFVLLAAVSAAFTRTTELAQVTTLPVMFACFFGSGLLLPAASPWEPYLRFLPLSPVLELISSSWAGGPVLIPVLIMAGWIVAGAYAANRWFRWEPRR